MTSEIMRFQAQTQQLLHLMIHSLYSNKEIFLRELISNASDAADKLRFEAIADPSLYENDPDLKIRVSYNAAARTVTVEDNGIGMSRDDAIAHLGTIARSGTKEFFAQLMGDARKDGALIGQFGVGFYSAFIVAERIVVESRRAGLPAAEGVRWQSTGEGEFSVETIERSARGTIISLHLRAGEDDFLSGWRLKSIIQKYSDHIALPIWMPKEEWNQEKNAMVRCDEEEIVNQASALWTRPKNDIDEAQYRSFYQHLTHDSQAPLAWAQHRVEGRSEYIQLLYLPARAPFDLYDRTQRGGLKLYIKRVFIMDDAQQLLPSYLRFVRGVVDSNDLPLNVSREILQESRDVKTIREGVAKRVLTLLEDLAQSDQDKYAVFWREFGQTLKEGIGEDPANRDQITALLRFASTHLDSAEQTVALADYMARMKEGQSKIYYVCADSWRAARNSPHLEVFRAKGVEVLLLTDRVDEWMLSFLREFDGKPLASVARGDLDLGALSKQEKESQQTSNKTLQPLMEKMQEALKDKVKEVRSTCRLIDSPSCLVVDEGEMSGYLQRLLKAAGQNAPESRPILEINPEHALIKQLHADQADFEDWCHILFDQALLAEGGMLEDPAAYVKRVNARLLP